MSNVSIAANNYLDPNVISNATVSSEQASFPVSNLYNRQRRSKVWRSSGYWEITASNNIMVFRESVGVDLTATITVGNYTSSTDLLAEIKTQLEAAGASTYTCVIDSTTKKVKFTSNGVGGGGIFQIIWTSTAVTQALASTLGFLTTENDTGALTYSADSLKNGTGEWIKWDFGISTNPTAFILIGKRNESIQITPGATIKLQGNETNEWANPSYETTLTYTDSIISIFSATGLHTEGLRYWRLYIDDTANPLGFVEIGKLYLGSTYAPTRGAVQYPFVGEKIDSSPTIFSEGGQTFSDIRQQSERFELDWFGLTYSEKEQIDVIFDAQGTGLPFYILMDPSANFSSTTNYYTRFVKFEAPPKYRLESFNNFSCTMSLREEL